MKYLFYTLCFIPFFAKAQDKTAPTISNFWTQDTVLIAVFSDFESQIPRFSIIDDVDGDITNLASINQNVNDDSVGFYNFTIEAKDQSENVFSKTVVIEIADTIAPQIMLSGKMWNFIPFNGEFIEKGFTVSDNYSNSKGLAVTTFGSYNRRSQGRYCISFFASDESRNESEIKYRIICVALDSMDCASLPGKICSDVKTGLSSRQFHQASIFPNPSNGQFFVYAENTFDIIEVYNVQGELILTTINQDFKLSTPGIYLLKASTQTGSIFIQKLVVE